MRPIHMVLTSLLLVPAWPLSAAGGSGWSDTDDPWVGARQQALFESKSLELVGVDTESEGDVPRVCIKFSEALQERGAVRYEDYVRFDPEIPAAFSARGKQLCSGFEHKICFRPARRRLWYLCRESR